MDDRPVIAEPPRAPREGVDAQDYCLTGIDNRDRDLNQPLHGLRRNVKEEDSSLK